MQVQISIRPKRGNVVVGIVYARYVACLPAAQLSYSEYEDAFCGVALTAVVGDASLVHLPRLTLFCPWILVPFHAAIHVGLLSLSTGAKGNSSPHSVRI